MSKHWRLDSDAMETPWGRAKSYRRSGGPGVAVAVVAGAVLLGVSVGYWLDWRRATMPAKPDAPIEWSAVQKVPVRAPDAADVAWEKRSEGIDVPSPADPDPMADKAGSMTAIAVVDGDTIVMGGRRIRIAGLDAPETHPARCAREAQLGRAATERLRELLSSGTVTVSGAGHDKYGRELRQVQVDGVDVEQAMISTGLASSYAGGKRRNWC